MQNPQMKLVPDVTHRVDWNLIKTSRGQGSTLRGRKWKPPNRTGEDTGCGCLVTASALAEGERPLCLGKEKGPGETWLVLPKKAG